MPFELESLFVSKAPDEVRRHNRPCQSSHFALPYVRRAPALSSCVGAAAVVRNQGYRLLATEGFFVPQLMRISKSQPPVPIERVRTPDMAARLGKMTRTRPIPDSLLGDDAPFRQYVALEGEDIVGRVRSVDAIGATWCADMFVNPAHRRRGIGQALLGHMLRDDRARGSKCSVLTASHAGALLYPRVGYERIGTPLMFVPSRAKRS